MGLSDEQPAAPLPNGRSADAGDAIDLAALEAQASALEGQADVEGVIAAPTNTAAELRGALELARVMVAPMMAWWPEFGQVWSDKAIGSIADAGALVMDKHGWTMGGLMTEFGPYIALVGAVAPPSLVTWQAIKAQREAVRTKGRTDERAQSPAH